MPLHTACGKGHVDCVKELLRQHQLTGVDCDMPVSASDVICLSQALAKNSTLHFFKHTFAASNTYSKRSLQCPLQQLRGK